MTVVIKTDDEIAKMRVAGRLASQVLDFIQPKIRAGITTEELDSLCHDFMVNVQGTIPAPAELRATRIYALSQVRMHVG